MTASDPSDISPFRASDADRDHAAAIIGTALAEGRLTPEEHAGRIDQVYAARSQADLALLVRDLPAPAASQQPLRASAATQPGRGIVAIFSGASRKGLWRVGRATDVVTVFGGAELDLRNAVLPAREITVRAVCLFGGMSVTVPPEMHVTDSGVAVFGSRDICADSTESLRHVAPTLRLTGACVFGSIEVRRKRRKARKDNGRAAGEITG